MPKTKKKSEEKKVYWFDLRFTYADIARLDKLRGGRTQMEYIEDATRLQMARDEGRW